MIYDIKETYMVGAAISIRNPVQSVSAVEG